MGRPRGWPYKHRMAEEWRGLDCDRQTCDCRSPPSPILILSTQTNQRHPDASQPLFPYSCKTTTMNAILRLNSADLEKALSLRLRIQAYDRQLLAIHAKARRRPSEPSAFSLQTFLPTQVSGFRPPPCFQPSLRDLISGILKAANQPMSLQAIYEATPLWSRNSAGLNSPMK